MLFALSPSTQNTLLTKAQEAKTLEDQILEDIQDKEKIFAPNYKLRRCSIKFYYQTGTHYYGCKTYKELSDLDYYNPSK